MAEGHTKPATGKDAVEVKPLTLAGRMAAIRADAFGIGKSDIPMEYEDKQGNRKTYTIKGHTVDAVLSEMRPLLVKHGVGLTPMLREPEYPEVHPRKYLTPKLKAQLALKQNGLCALCGCKPRAFEWDHILELWAGGTNDLPNWQGLCRKCHSNKSGAEAKHRAKMNRCRGKAGQLKRRKERGSLIKSRNTLSLPLEGVELRDRGKMGGGFWRPKNFKHKWPKQKFNRSARAKPAR